jgi:hypothetical protein
MPTPVPPGPICVRWFADAATLDAVQELVSSDAPDPVALWRIDWELAPSYCPECELNYCRADWQTFPIFDEGFYDCTMSSLTPLPGAYPGSTRFCRTRFTRSVPLPYSPDRVRNEHDTLDGRSADHLDAN